MLSDIFVAFVLLTPIINTSAVYRTSCGCSCCINGECRNTSDCATLGYIAGPVISVVGCIIVICCIYCCYRRRRRQMQTIGIETQLPPGVITTFVQPGYYATGSPVNSHFATSQQQFFQPGTGQYPVEQGFQLNGYGGEPGVYNQQGIYPQQTYPQQAYPQQAYPQQAYPQQAYPQQGYPQQAYPQQAYPQQAYPQQSYPQQMYPQPTYQRIYPQQTHPQQNTGFTNASTQPGQFMNAPCQSGLQDIPMANIPYGTTTTALEPVNMQSAVSNPAPTAPPLSSCSAPPFP